LRVGSYEIPEIRFNSGAFNDIKKIYDNVKSVDRQIHANDLALLLGYKTPTSGGFYRRINSLISYGLLEGRGKFRVTKNGEDILYPRNEDHRNQLVRESVLKVALWNELYKKFRRELPANLWLEIKDLTGVSSAEAQSVEKEVRRWYLNDTEGIAGEGSLENLTHRDSSDLSQINDFAEYKRGYLNSQAMSNTTMRIDEIEEIPFAGKYAIKKPANEDIRKSWERLKKYMEIYLEDFDADSTNPATENSTSGTDQE
jgi:hypothetical protein